MSTLPTISHLLLNQFWYFSNTYRFYVLVKSCSSYSLYERISDIVCCGYLCDFYFFTLHYISNDMVLPFYMFLWLVVFYFLWLCYCSIVITIQYQGIGCIGYHLKILQEFPEPHSFLCSYIFSLCDGVSSTTLFYTSPTYCSSSQSENIFESWFS